MIKPRTYIVTAAAVVTAVVLSGCAGNSTRLPGMDMGSGTSMSGSPSANAAGTFNDADVMFAQTMLPHHEEAVAMSDVLLAKTGVDPRVTDLAKQIKAAQEPEIVQLKDWLTAWGVKMSGGSMSSMGGGMSAADMAALDKATAPAVNRLFLEQMTVHHTSAVKMAQTEVDQGKNPDAKKLAENIVRTQTDEIKVMKDILATL